MFGLFHKRQRSQQLSIPFDGSAERIRFYVLLSAGLLLAVPGLPLLAYTAVQSQFERLERRAALGYARSVINRSDRISVSIDEAFSSLAKIEKEEFCSPDSIAAMQAIVLANPDIAVVGYAQGDRLLCSSLVAQLNWIALGAVNFTGQYQVRRNVRLAFARHASFNVLEQNGWVIFIPQMQSIDVSIPQGVALATYSTLAR